MFLDFLISCYQFRYLTKMVIVYFKSPPGLWTLARQAFFTLHFNIPPVARPIIPSGMSSPVS